MLVLERTPWFLQIFQGAMQEPLLSPSDPVPGANRGSCVAPALCRSHILNPTEPIPAKTVAPASLLFSRSHAGVTFEPFRPRPRRKPWLLHGSCVMQEPHFESYRALPSKKNGLLHGSCFQGAMQKPLLNPSEPVSGVNRGFCVMQDPHFESFRALPSKNRGSCISPVFKESCRSHF